MKTYFYVIEWHDGSGKTSGIVKGLDAREALRMVYRTNSLLPDDLEPQDQGTIITFNKVED